ncbi:MAG: hypothetical protein K6F50_10040 [Kiritimatiellae bacterium]|nr:hypothetical protein [Kiritimatiellia bacterium]
MTELRAKDKLFLAFLLPAAAVAAYVWFWRIDEAKKIKNLEATCSSLIGAEDRDMEKSSALADLADAKRRLEAEKAIPPAKVSVDANPSSSEADREGDVLRIFVKSGLSVLRAEPVDPGPNGERFGLPGRDALISTGFRPSPALRRYTLDGPYPAMRNALDSLADGLLAVVPAALEMSEAGHGRWVLTLWL